MSRDGGFSIISVDSHEDDELVIRVGARKDEHAGKLHNERPETAYFEKEASTTDVGEQSESLSRPSKKEADSDDCRTTALNELNETGPSPKIRIAIILSALVLLAVALFLYFVNL